MMETKRKGKKEGERKKKPEKKFEKAKKKAEKKFEEVKEEIPKEEEKEKEKGQIAPLSENDMKKVKEEVSAEILNTPIRKEINNNFAVLFKMLTNIHEFVRKEYGKIYSFVIPLKKFEKTLIKINMEEEKLSMAGIEDFRNFSIPKISAVIMLLYKPVSSYDDLKKDIVDIVIEREDTERKKEILKYMQKAEFEDKMEKEHILELEKCETTETREILLKKFVDEGFKEQEEAIDGIGKESGAKKIFKKRYIPSVDTFENFIGGIKAIIKKGDTIPLIPQLSIDFGDIYKRETNGMTKEINEEGKKKLRYIFTCYRIIYKICEKNLKLHEEHRNEVFKFAQAKIVELLMGKEESKSSSVFSDIIGTAIDQSKKKVEELETFGISDDIMGGGAVSQGSIMKSVVDNLQGKIEGGSYREKDLRKIGDKLFKGKSRSDIAKQFACKNVHEIMAQLQKGLGTSLGGK